MRPQSSVLSLALGLSLVCPPGHADEGAPAETVVISATRTPTPESSVASSITVITSEQIEAQQVRTLPDVLKEVPGLNLVQVGGPGGQTSVFMRGTNANHTKVLIDGIDVSDPSNPNGAFDYGQLLTADVERVEVLRGPQSGLYGSDAIGGVINVITRSGSGPAQLDLSLEGGSFDTFNQTARLRGSEGGFHYSVALTHLHAGATPVTPLELLAPGEKRNDDYDDNLTFSSKLGLQLSPSLDLGLVARETSTHLRFTGEDYDPVTFLGTPAVNQSEGDTQETYARFFVHGTTGGLEQTLGYAYTRKRSAGYVPDTPVTVNRGERSKVDWQGIVPLEGQTLLLGAEHERDEVSEPLSAASTLNSGYVELQSQLGGFSSALNVRYDDHSRFGGRTTYRIALSYRLQATGTRLKSSYGTGFKAPSLSQLFQDMPAFFFFANPDLKPEESSGWDVGVEQDLGSTARIGATYYHNHLHDLIDYNESFTSFINVARATTKGIEGFVTWSPLQSLSLRADYTYTQATNDLLDQTLLRRPRHKISLTSTWQPTKALSFSASLLTLSDWIDVNRDGSIPRLTAPGYTTVNLAGAYDLTPQLRLLARLDNLTDRRAQNPTGFLLPPLGAFAGLELRL